ncbi:MAG: hypothetical protein HC834_09315 [Rhodospirillales bacterium]|nr:hypothetical protein [Rhodospirillales bacterium]
MSRRWLEAGPWRLVRDAAADLTLLQFHDLEADEATALAQAQPGHRLAGGTDEGGFIWSDFTFEVLKPAHYDRTHRTSVVLVQDREITPREMLEAAAARRIQPFPGISIDQVAFVFFDEAQARRQLRDLWLRGLECRALTPGGERRLDEDYVPEPVEVADWVKRVQDREGF